MRLNRRERQALETMAARSKPLAFYPRTCAILHQRGLAEQVRYAPGIGAWSYRITDAGRAALAELHAEAARASGAA